MMPGVGFDGGTFDRNGFTQNEAEQTFFHDDHHKQYQQCERRGGRTRMTDLFERLHSNPDRCQQENGRNSRRRYRFRFAMAIRVVFIGWFSRNYQPPPYNHRTENVGHRFDRIGHQRMRMAHDAGDELDRRKRGIYRQAQEGGAQTAFEPILNHSETYRSGLKK